MTDIVALGAGRMGRGIAQVFAYAGHDVTILDFKERTAEDSDKLLAEGKVEIAENLKFLYSLGIGKEENFPVILGRIKGGSIDDADTVLGNAKFIFEGVPELLDLKKDALGRASDLAGADTIIASTTSTMLSTELAGFTSRPENFLNAHITLVCSSTNYQLAKNYPMINTFIIIDKFNFLKTLLINFKSFFSIRYDYLFILDAKKRSFKLAYLVKSKNKNRWINVNMNNEKKCEITKQILLCLHTTQQREKSVRSDTNKTTHHPTLPSSSRYVLASAGRLSLPEILAGAHRIPRA